ncbi:MAG: 50S ribosomal protein L4 [Armatimonadetes bacterium]|nr:50S ribosomal protein L4 [Armatimonadota bacterium]MDW8121160.1 50S ribosomal protein L4 [Armatimonadota bacterium]
MELPIYNLEGSQTGVFTIPDDIVHIEVNVPLLHQVVVAHQANRRQGTHSTLRRGEVSGGGRKPWSQKRTGRARQGSIRAPQWRHGGIVHGPKPVRYRQKINKKMKEAALRMAWAVKLREGEVLLIDGLNQMNGPKTKVFHNLFTTLGILGKRILLLLPEKSESVLLSVRNVPRVDTLPVLQPSTEDLLQHKVIVTTPQALSLVLERRFGWSYVQPGS